ncbi:MAG: cob(I)yrinic acid a,c-diamide adenosyltransferase [Actinomycetota bacterium]|nr:cob(I)yrinic acid a,c-diamide adenosyltransferase [Actinomycetota bacterium]
MTEGPPTDDPTPELRRAPSLVLLNTGDGKGKSTAAMGVMLRSVARGWRVAVVQFLKSGDWATGEQKAAERLGVDWWALGDGFTWDSDDLDKSAEVAREAWKKAEEIIASGEYSLVILDEVTYPLTWGWVDLDEVTRVIRARPQHVNLVLTGRDAPDELVEVADTVTEMRNVKHAFQQGIRAKKGIDF